MAETTGTMGKIFSAKNLDLLGNFLSVGSDIYGSILQSRVAKAQSGIFGAQSGLMGAQAELFGAEGEYESAVSQFNAAIARANALAVQEALSLELARQKRAAKKLRGTQVAGYAASGVKLEGSPLLAMIDSATQANLDMAITEYNAKQAISRAGYEARAYDIAGGAAVSKARAVGAIKGAEAGMVGLEGNLLRSRASFAKGQSFIKGATTLLSTVGEYVKKK